jgi:hypothetical protein
MFYFDAAKLIKNIDIANTLARIICCGGLFWFSPCTVLEAEFQAAQADAHQP